MRIRNYLFATGMGLLLGGNLEAQERWPSLEQYRKSIPDNLFFDPKTNTAYIHDLSSTPRVLQSFETHRNSVLSRIDGLISEEEGKGSEARIKALKKRREQIVSEPSRIIHDTRNFTAEIQVLENHLNRLQNEQPENESEINRIKGILAQGYHLGRTFDTRIYLDPEERERFKEKAGHYAREVWEADKEYANSLKFVPALAGQEPKTGKNTPISWENIESELIGEPALEINSDDWINSDSIELNDLKGKVVLLDFWATWCGPCVGSLPELQRLDKKYEKEGFELITIHNRRSPGETVEDHRKTIEDFLAKNCYSFPAAIDTHGEIFDEYEIRGVPTQVIINRNGNISHMHVGTNPNIEILVREHLGIVDK